MDPVRVAVCEAPAELTAGGPEWEPLCARAKALQPALMLLNEMPFGPWLASGPVPDAAAMVQSCRTHEAGIARLGDLGCSWVAGSRPVLGEDRMVNQGFVWAPDRGVAGVHTKQFFPDEPGYYEARWFSRGETHFRLAAAAGLRIGFLICTEVMFNEWARHYGRQGADLLLVPRATPVRSTPRWKIALAAAAMVSGCYLASSNRGGVDPRGQEFGGHGWVFTPDGELLAETSEHDPVVTADIQPERAAAAKGEYPRYVEDLAPDASAAARAGGQRRPTPAVKINP